MGAVLALGAVGAGVTAIKQILDGGGDAPKPAVVQGSCPAKGFTDKDTARLGGYVERTLPALAQCFQQTLPRVRLRTRGTTRTATIEVASEPGEKAPQVRFLVDGAGAASSASAELVHDERFRACAAQQLAGTFPEKYAKIPVTVRADVTFDFANRRAVTAELAGAPEVDVEARGPLMEPALAVIREKFALFAEDEGAHGLTGLNVTVGADGRLAAVEAVTAGGQIGPAVAKLAERLTGICLPRLGKPYEYSLPVARDDDEH